MLINKVLIEFHIAIQHLYILLCICVTNFVLFGPNITDSKGQTQKRVTYINNYGRYKILINFFFPMADTSMKKIQKY